VSAYCVTHTRHYHHHHFPATFLPQCTLEDLTECIAENVAMPVEVRIIKDRETNTSKGYGFLTFASVQDAERCLAHSSITCQKRLLNFGPAKHKRRSDDFSAAAGNYAPVYNSAPVDPSSKDAHTCPQPTRFLTIVVITESFCNSDLFSTPIFALSVGRPQLTVPLPTPH
jgi:RNA recognition motif-containing protein